MNTKEFIAKLESDLKENNFELLEKVQAAGQNPEAVYAIIKEAGVTDSLEVFQAELTACFKEMGGELNEEELASVSGGMGRARAASLAASFSIKDSLAAIMVALALA